MDIVINIILVVIMVASVAAAGLFLLLGRRARRVGPPGGRSQTGVGTEEDQR